MNATSAWLVAFAMLVAMKIVCFVLGYLTIRLGHRLIAAGVRGDFEFSAELGGAKADLASVSPGLLFVLLGIALIGIALRVDKSVTLQTTRPEEVKKPAIHLPIDPSLDSTEDRPDAPS